MQRSTLCNDLVDGSLNTVFFCHIGCDGKEAVWEAFRQNLEVIAGFRDID
jgi:hypothetical protein